MFKVFKGAAAKELESNILRKVSNLRANRVIEFSGQSMDREVWLEKNGKRKMEGTQKTVFCEADNNEEVVVLGNLNKDTYMI